MDIERLYSKRQLNVQQQNALTKQAIIDCAVAYRQQGPSLAWVRSALLEHSVDTDKGILTEASSVPCGGGEEAAYATWLTLDRQFLSIEAAISWDEHTLILVESFENVTERINTNSHNKGTGKSFGCLALEVLDELSRTEQ